jgi:hypothetical protein
VLHARHRQVTPVLFGHPFHNPRVRHCSPPSFFSRALLRAGVSVFRVDVPLRPLTRQRPDLDPLGCLEAAVAGQLPAGLRAPRSARGAGGADPRVLDRRWARCLLHRGADLGAPRRSAWRVLPHRAVGRPGAGDPDGAHRPRPRIGESRGPHRLPASSGAPEGLADVGQLLPRAARRCLGARG